MEDLHTVQPTAVAEHLSWTPTVGQETYDFLDNIVPVDSQDVILSSATDILSKCIPPTASEGRETGVVIGYVQSGKTMSFEAVAALACDNEFQVVIVLAGVSNPLLTQSTTRMVRDLRLEDPQRPRKWIQFTNPDCDHPTINRISDLIAEWRDETTPDMFKQTLLITVLKNHQRLQNLAALFSSLDMAGVPVLIIDDEADQASLNTQINQGYESSTYRRLIQLREALPHHTYLQYTATPQAPLLVNIIDTLSPNFVQVLDPGVDYIGGQEFFAEDSPYVRVIPQADVPTNAVSLETPPESLISALRVFMVGVTIGILESNNIGNRSMLVHPSHRTMHHQEYCGWVRHIFDEWKQILSLPESEFDRMHLLEDFRDAYDDLCLTANDLMPDFDTVASSLLYALRKTRIEEINSRAGMTPQVDWRGTYGWILIGGQALDRGFTVEGLTVTYMPRGIGVGNADTIQQRARFFGYKRPYLGFCRVYLEATTLDSLRNYTHHEDDIRAQLLDFQHSREPLDNWKRAFVLDNRLRPCRNNVLDLDYIRGSFSDDWFVPRNVLAPDFTIRHNRTIISNFVNGLEFDTNPGHPRRSQIQTHLLNDRVPLRDLLSDFLVDLKYVEGSDSQRVTGLLLQLGRALDHDPNERCSIYIMSPQVSRSRTANANGAITYLFQGSDGDVYPGDRLIRHDTNVSIQIHSLQLDPDDDPSNPIDNTIFDVPVVAVWVPGRLSTPWISQSE